MENKFDTKWIWYGGAAVIALLVFSRGLGGSGGGNAADLAAVTQLNQIGAALNAKQIDSYTQLGLAKYQHDASVSSGFFATLQNFDRDATMHAIELSQASAGITNNIVTYGSAVAMDSINQAAKTQQTEISADAAYRIAQVNAQVAIAAAKAQEHASLFGTIGKIVGSVAGVAGSIFGA